MSEPFDIEDAADLVRSSMYADDRQTWRELRDALDALAAIIDDHARLVAEAALTVTGWTDETADALSNLAGRLEADDVGRLAGEAFAAATRAEVEIIAGTDSPDGDGWEPVNAFVDGRGMNCVLWRREVRRG